MPAPAQLKPKRSRPHARRSGIHRSQILRTKKCPTAAFTGAISYNFSSISQRSHYDSANRHSQTSVSKDGEASKITYLHNAAGQRAFKSEPQAAQYLPNEQTLGPDFIAWLKKNFAWLFAAGQANATLGDSYIYADSQGTGLPSYALLGEYGNGGTGSGGRTEYLWLPTEDGGAIPIAIARSGKLLAVHTDHLGTPRQLKDETNKVVWQWPYSAFGENKPTGTLTATANPKAAITNQPILLKATTPTEFNLRLPGQYYDQESGLFYNYFRSYNPAQGRYTQADPIGLEGGINRFGYAEGNPLSFTDPMGLVASNDPWFGYGGDKGFKDWWHGQKPYYGGQDIPNKEVCDNLYKDYKESNERGKGSKSGRGGKNRGDKRSNVNELLRNGGRGGYGRGGSEE